jgi:hypothetical protein
MNYQTRNGEQVGDLIHYTDYAVPHTLEPQHYIGVLLDYNSTVDAFIVLCEGKTTSWLAWQCEVVS